MGYKISGIMLVLMVAMGITGRWYYNATQERLIQLRENSVKLELAAATSQETIQLLKEDVLRFEETTATMAVELNRSEEYTDELQAKLSRHNLTVLTMQKPGLIETRVNNATEQLFRDMETITGATISD